MKHDDIFVILAYFLTSIRLQPSLKVKQQINDDNCFTQLPLKVAQQRNNDDSLLQSLLKGMCNFSYSIFFSRTTCVVFFSRFKLLSCLQCYPPSSMFTLSLLLNPMSLLVSSLFVPLIVSLFGFTPPFATHSSHVVTATHSTCVAVQLFTPLSSSLVHVPHVNANLHPIYSQLMCYFFKTYPSTSPIVELFKLDNLKLVNLDKICILDTIGFPNQTSKKNTQALLNCRLSTSHIIFFK